MRVLARAPPSAGGQRRQRRREGRWREHRDFFFPGAPQRQWAERSEGERTGASASTERGEGGDSADDDVLEGLR